VEELVNSDIALQFALVSTSLEDSERGRALRNKLAQRARVEMLADNELKRHAATDQPQGVLAVARAPAQQLDDIALEERTTLLIADAVQDPGNFGTLVRIADAFAAAAVIALPGTVDVWNPKVVRATAGSAFHLPVISTDHSSASAWSSTHRFQVVGADVEGGPAEDAKLDARVALVVGNEGAGLTPETRAWVHERISVRMPGNAESLNVSVAAGILMYLVSRR
jgi:TrmH family RNA methyltransferase